MIIHLSNLRFYSYHGVYEEERLIGGEYVVNVDVGLTEPQGKIEQLEQTVNYVEAYDFIKNRMAQPTPLLETIAMDLAEGIINLSPLIENVKVNLQKFALPIEGFQGNTAVTYMKKK